MKNFNIKNDEEKLLKNVTELTTIKLNARKEFLLDEALEYQINQLIEGFTWLYMKGLINSKSPKTAMNDEEKQYFERLVEVFADFNTFMANNMSLKEI